MHGVGTMAMLANAGAIAADVEGVNKMTKAQLAQSLTRTFALSRPAVADEAAKVASAIVEGEVETLDWQHTVKDWSSSGSYINFADDANLIFPWEKGTATNQAKSGQWDVVQWSGFVLNHNIQAATLAELQQKGVVEIHWGDAKTPKREVPLENFLMTRINKFTSQGALASGAAPLETHVEQRYSGFGFSFDPHRLLVVRPGDRDPKFKIIGLAGTIAGSSPALTVQYKFKGIRVRV